MHSRNNGLVPPKDISAEEEVTIDLCEAGVSEPMIARVTGIPKLVEKFDDPRSGYVDWFKRDIKRDINRRIP